MNTSKEFVEFAEDMFNFNSWIDKREMEEWYAELYPETLVSAHMFKKWLEEYCNENGAILELKSTAGKYLFKMEKKVVKDD